MTSEKLFRSSLTLGATGMLNGALEYVARQSETTWVLSRHGKTFADSASGKRLIGLDVDYAETEGFWRTLGQNIDLNEMDVALLWVHDHGKPVLLELLKQLKAHTVTTIHVSGSATGNPEKQIERVSRHITLSADFPYIPVILGAIKTPQGHRWLTHDEISQGVIQAIVTSKPQMVGVSPQDP